MFLSLNATEFIAVTRLPSQDSLHQGKQTLAIHHIVGSPDMAPLKQLPVATSVTVPRHCSAVRRECSIVSALDIGHYEAVDGASDEAVVDG